MNSLIEFHEDEDGSGFGGLAAKPNPKFTITSNTFVFLLVLAILQHKKSSYRIGISFAGR